jgi:hypothetical protein
MENSPFIDDFPIETSIYKGFSMAMLCMIRDPSNKNGGRNQQADKMEILYFMGICSFI